MEVLTLMLALMLGSMPVLMLELMVELFAGFASAATCPQDATASKRQVVSNNKRCLMVVTGV
jgi:hypothetical protein